MSCTEMEGARDTNAMELSTASGIEIEILVPNENFVPVGVLRRAGNFVMQRVVDIGVPQVSHRSFQHPVVFERRKSHPAGKPLRIRNAFGPRLFFFRLVSVFVRACCQGVYDMRPSFRR